MLQATRFANVLESEAILGDVVEAGFPYKGHIAGIRGLESPGEKGGNWVPSNYANIH